MQLQIKHDAEKNMVRVDVIQARNLPAADFNGFSDPFVTLELLPRKK